MAESESESERAREVEAAHEPLIIPPQPTGRRIITFQPGVARTDNPHPSHPVRTLVIRQVSFTNKPESQARRGQPYKRQDKINQDNSAWFKIELREAVAQEEKQG